MLDTTLQPTEDGTVQVFLVSHLRKLRSTNALLVEVMVDNGDKECNDSNQMQFFYSYEKLNLDGF